MKTFAKRCIHTGTWPGLAEVAPSGKPTSAHNKRFRVGDWPSRDGGLRPFGAAHGIGRRKVKVAGDRSSLVSLARASMETVDTCG